jgi:uncharacterized protein (DUF1330 family)
MSYEMIVGLQVIDDRQYEDYRLAMTPMLSAYGGSFGFDFRVSEVLSAGTSQDINRAFAISFPEEDTMNAFFSGSEYLAVKALYFEGAVSSTSILSSCEKEGV